MATVAPGPQPDWSTVVFLGTLIGLAALVLRANGIVVRYWRSRLGPDEMPGWVPSREYWREHPPDPNIVELGNRWSSDEDPDGLWSLCWDRGRLVADRRPALPPPVVQGVFGGGAISSAGLRAQMAAHEFTRVIALGVPRGALDELAHEVARWRDAPGGADALIDALEERYGAVRTGV